MQEILKNSLDLICNLQRVLFGRRMIHLRIIQFRSSFLVLIHMSYINIYRNILNFYESLSIVDRDTLDKT